MTVTHKNTETPAQNTAISPDFLEWKFSRVSGKFRVALPTLCGNHAFPQNIRTRTLRETLVFME